MALFTATRAQVATYLLGVCPFSIAFLVFLNSSVSFVITDLIGKHDSVGNAVGNLGFADELLAILACPVWGLLSDKVGVRSVCMIGYVIIGAALIVFVQARDVYPQLLLARLLFSLGGSAASTMVTAVLPAMSFADEKVPLPVTSSQRHGHASAASVASEITITPANYSINHEHDINNGSNMDSSSARKDATSKIAGFVGMATGCGALIALSLFLPLPARFQKFGVEPGLALQYSYYIVGSIALILAIVCGFGLVGLRSEEGKGWRHLITGKATDDSLPSNSITSTIDLLYRAFVAGFHHGEIFIGYVGGFVARASSVGISLFIPLLVNAAFLRSGLCEGQDALDTPGLPDIKRRCPRAYVVAAELTGASQLVALLCAPLFGYWSSRLSNKRIPLLTAALAGIVGYPLFSLKFDPHDDNTQARIVAFLAVCLIGISQIGAIVCSLGILSKGVLSRKTSGEQGSRSENAPLLESSSVENRGTSLTELKGSVAGVYSLYGGVGILILTKAGGALFDKSTNAAPFHMMAIFNGLLALACLGVRLFGNRSSQGQEAE